MEKGNDGKNEEHKKTRFCGVLRRLSVDIMGASRRKRGTVFPEPCGAVCLSWVDGDLHVVTVT